MYGRLSALLGDVVLDVGGGSGVVSARLSGYVVLVDVADWCAEPLPFVLGDGAALPFRSCSCSGVHLARVLHHVASWRAVLAEAVRVLRPGGALCLSLGDRPVTDELRVLADRAIDLAVARGFVSASSPVIDPDAVADELARLGCPLVDSFAYGADVPVTPRAVVTGAVGNPFRWAAGQDLGAVPDIVAEALADVAPDRVVLRDRTVRYSVHRRHTNAAVSIFP